MPEAMTIASATSDGVPSARLVVLRGLRPGLVFFTDGESDKGAELAANPRAAAVLHWLVPAHRQVRVAGPVERVSQDEADQYWSTRGPAARLSAAASRQSRVVASRTVLETQVRDILRRHPDGADVPRPRRWSGFRVLPIPRRVLAGIAGRSARPDPLPPGRQRLDHRAAVAVTTDGLSNQKTTTIKPPCPVTCCRSPRSAEPGEALAPARRPRESTGNWPPGGPMSTTTSWNSRCKLLPGLRTAKTSATHLRGNLRRDNGLLPRSGPRLSCLRL